MQSFAATVIVAHWSAQSRHDWTQRTDRFIRFCEERGVIYAHQVGKAEALAFQQLIAGTDRSPGIAQGRTIAHYLSAARSLFRAELLWREPPCITRNPFEGLPRVKIRKRPKVLVEIEQLRCFLSCADELSRMIFQAIYAGGMRRGEFRLLTWKQVKEDRIDLGDDLSFEGKNERAVRTIHMNRHLKEALDWFRARSGHKKYVLDAAVFRTSLGTKEKVHPATAPVSPAFIYEKFALVKRIAQDWHPEYNWEGFTPHKLRSAYGSHIIELGGSLTIVGELMGHGDEQTTKDWYISISPGTRQDTARMLDKIDLGRVN